MNSIRGRERPCKISTTYILYISYIFLTKVVAFTCFQFIKNEFVYFFYIFGDWFVCLSDSFIQFIFLFSVGWLYSKKKERFKNSRDSEIRDKLTNRKLCKWQTRKKKWKKKLLLLFFFVHSGNKFAYNLRLSLKLGIFSANFLMRRNKFHIFLNI